MYTKKRSPSPGGLFLFRGKRASYLGVNTKPLGDELKRE